MRKAILQVFTGSLASKALGLGREVITAALFGTGQIIGAFRVAQTGTLVPVNFFISDAMTAAFVPLYKQFRTQSHEKAQILFWALLALFVTLATVISIGLWIVPTRWVGTLAPGLTMETASLSVKLLRVMAVGVPFYVLSALLLFRAMAHDDFVPMAVRPIVQNVGLIMGVVVGFVLHELVFLAWGFTISYILFSAWVLQRSFRAGYLLVPAVWEWPQVRAILHAFWLTLRPLLLLPVLLQGNIVVERAVASLIGLAAISGLDYGRFVTETLILLVSVPVAFAGLSRWSGLSREAICQGVEKVLVLTLVIAIPASAFLAANAHDIIKAIYARGAFDATSVVVTGNILFGIAPGLWAQVVGYVLIKALNAQMRNHTVLAVMSVALVSNAIFDLVIYPYLGAMTLGIGNSVYGVVLFCGAVTALGMWGVILKRGSLLLIGVVFYLFLGQWLPRFDNVWIGLVLAGIFAAIFWLSWIALIKPLRHASLDIVVPQVRKIA